MRRPRERWLAGGAIAAIAAAGGYWFVAHRSLGPDDVSAESGQPPSYRAEVHRLFTGPEGQFESDEIVAYMNDASRHEWAESGRRFATITRKGQTWLVDLDRNAYTAIGDPDATSTGALTGEQIEAFIRADGQPGIVEQLGVEQTRLDGHPCRLVRSRLVGLGGETTDSAVWSALDLDGLAIRSELTGPDGGRSVIELRKITLDPDPQLFDLPAGAIADPDLARR